MGGATASVGNARRWLRCDPQQAHHRAGRSHIRPALDCQPADAITGSHAAARGDDSACRQRYGPSDAAGENPWREWAFARVTLGLTDREYGYLTPWETLALA